MDMKLSLGILVLLSLSGSVFSGFCTEEVDCRKTCTSTLWFLKFFGIKEFTYKCGGKCNETKCCAGYEGADCSKLTTDCIQNGKCLGHKYEEEYTDGLVNGPCDKPCIRTACSAGFTGNECNEKYDQDSAFLSQTELHRIKKQLEVDEGNIDEIYRDSEGYPTFGIGHLIRKSDPEHGLSIGTKISETRIKDAFEADVHIAKQSILKIFPKAGGFPGEVKEILVNMAFNLGETRLKKFRKFIAAVNKGNWSTAADEMVDSKWYQQVGNRAKRLVARMRSLATSQDSSGEGDDSGCMSLSGTCQEDNLPCTSGYESGLCSGHASRRCCLPSSDGDDSGCLSLSGTCQEDNLPCTSGYENGLCSGHTNRRCCLHSSDGDDSGCLSLSGTCQEDNLPCTSGYESGLCSGHANRRCCLPSSDGDDSGCLSLSGTCQEDNLPCTSGYENGLCSGHASRRCCLPSSDGDDSGCLSLSGTCQEDNLPCTSGYESGLCSGHASRRCCLPSSNCDGDDSGCLSLSGTCQEDNLPCTSGYENGLCSGHASRRCCLPSTGSCMNVTMISRSQWGARSPKATTNINVPVDMFFIHHTTGNSCYTLDECVSAVRGHQNYHMDNNNWSDIGYSFLVGEDGNIYEGRGWNYVGSHTAGYNSKSFAASFIGNYMTHIPGSKALQAVKNLISCGIERGKITPDYDLYGHRDVKDTACPGDELYAEIQTWPHYSHNQP